MSGDGTSGPPLDQRRITGGGSPENDANEVVPGRSVGIDVELTTLEDAMKVRWSAARERGFGQLLEEEK